MSKCPICYNEIKWQTCWDCKIDPIRMIIIKFKTYDSTINHLFEASKDTRRRERARCQIAKRNIRGWAKENLTKLQISKENRIWQQY